MWQIIVKLILKTWMKNLLELVIKFIETMYKFIGILMTFLKNIKKYTLLPMNMYATSVLQHGGISEIITNAIEQRNTEITNLEEETIHYFLNNPNELRTVITEDIRGYLDRMSREDSEIDQITLNEEECSVEMISDV